MNLPPFATDASYYMYNVIRHFALSLIFTNNLNILHIALYLELCFRFDDDIYIADVDNPRL